MITVGNHHIF